MLVDSLLIGRASGSVGGLTFYMGKGGLTVRTRTLPVNPQSNAQVKARDALGLSVQRWIDVLTQADRDKWETYALNVTLTNPLGEAINVSGMNMYVRSNAPRNRVGLAFVDVAPSVFDLGDFTPPVFDINGSNKSLTVNFTAADTWVGEDGSAMLLSTSPEQNPTINFLKSPFRRAFEILGDATTPPTSPVVQDGPFFHSIGNAMFTRARVSRADGRLSQITSSREIVTA